MMARWYEELFPVLEELGIGYVAFSPLANGFLTDRYDRNSKLKRKILVSGCILTITLAFAGCGNIGTADDDKAGSENTSQNVEAVSQNMEE